MLEVAAVVAAGASVGAGATGAGVATVGGAGAGAGAATGAGHVCGLAAVGVGTTVARTDENGLGAGTALLAVTGGADVDAAVVGRAFCAHAIGKAHIDKQKAVRATSGFKGCLCFTAALIGCGWVLIVNGGQPRRSTKNVTFAYVFTLGGFAAGVFGFYGIVYWWGGAGRC